MRVFSYSEARKNFSEVLNTARDNEVLIRRRNGETFSLAPVKRRRSPLDVEGIKTGVTTVELLAAVRESRKGA